MERRKLLGSFFGAALLPQEFLEAINPPSAKSICRNEDAAARFGRAQEFMQGLKLHIDGDPSDFFYHAGIVTQLGLTAFLFGKGLTDDWCKTQIGMDVEKALLTANHFGLEHTCFRMAEFSRLLGRYDRWRWPDKAELPDPSLIQLTQASDDLRRMIEHIQKELSQ